MVESEPGETFCVHIWVKGRVQGVGFRAFVQKFGIASDLAGWVRNVGYNAVEMVAEGRRDLLEKFAEIIKTGPPGSRVDEVRIEWESTRGDLQEFRVRHDG